MKVHELMEILATHDGNDEVLIATQPTYPLAFEVLTVAATEVYDIIDGEYMPEPGIVWIMTGDHPENPYAATVAWDKLETMGW